MVDEAGKRRAANDARHVPSAPTTRTVATTTTEAAAPGVAAPAAAAPAVAVAGTSESARPFADRVLDAVNAARAVARKCGDVDYPAAPPLQWNTQTEQAAMTQAAYLQQNNLFSHTGANGSTVGDRLTATGYVWQTVGENIAAGFTEIPAVVQGWLDSPGHCVNVMNGRYTDLGVVLLPGTSTNTYRTYWGMVLARPR